MRRCLVVGGSGTVGRAIADTLLREDARVALTFHQNEPTLEAPAFRCDVRRAGEVHAAVAAAAEALDGLDAVVFAAGVSGGAAFYEHLPGREHDRLGGIDATQFDEVMAVHARGALHVCQAAAAHLKARGGNIVLLAAIDGIKPVPAPVHFAASQAAMRGLTESLAHELGPWDICVNLLALGILEQGVSRDVGAEVKAAYLEHAALRRFGTAAEIAEVAAWMALDNTYVSGQTIVLDGGL